MESSIECKKYGRSAVLLQLQYYGTFIFDISSKSKYFRTTGWPKSCDTNVAAYTGRITNVMDLILADMCPFYQLFEDFSKSK